MGKGLEGDELGGVGRDEWDGISISGVRLEGTSEVG